MGLILLIVVLLLLFGGGGGYYGYRRWGSGGGIGIVGVVLIVLVCPIPVRRIAPARVEVSPSIGLHFAGPIERPGRAQRYRCREESV